MFGITESITTFVRQLRHKNMTTYQKTLSAYKKGLKSMAYLAFLNDSNANKGITFEQFCIGMDKILINHN